MLKKILYTLFSLLLLIPLTGIFDSNEVKADDKYSLSCPAFELSYIKDDGTFEKVECYDSFDEANAKMKELGGDHVVRNGKSLSPTKIISMNSGFAYTYSFRSGTSTQNIYASLDDRHNGSGATTYLTAHYEMTYHETNFYTEYFGYSGGYVKVTMNGFTGYADLEYVDLVPSKFVEKGIKITLGGNDRTGANEQPFEVICHQNYYEAKKSDDGKYTDLVFTFYRAWSPDGKDAISSSIAIGVAPSFMKEGARYYSNDGVNFYTDSKLTQLAGTYYNYYQFLPLRSNTDISADVMNAFLNLKAGEKNSILLNKASAFIDNQNKYGVNGAAILCMAIHESDWGTSNIARNKNNLFGWGAFDDNTGNATAYSSVSSCVEAQMADNLANYMDVKANVYFTMSLGNKGGGFITKYASDPYWAEKISRYYYELDKYSKNYDGTLTDYNHYSLALVNTVNAEVKKTADSNSETYYTTANKTGYQKNLIVITRDSAGEYTKTRTSNPIDDGEVIYPIELSKGTLVVYDGNESYGYIKTSQLTALNDGSQIVIPDPKPEDPVTVPSDSKDFLSLTSVSLDGNSLAVSGTAFFSKVNFTDASKIKHQLVVKDIDTGTEKAVYDLNTAEFGFSINDGYTYNQIAFNGTVEIKDLNTGNYTLYIRVTNSGASRDIPLTSSNNKYSDISSAVETADYRYINRISSNSMYGYRLELEITSTNIDYTVNKPEVRNSMFVYDSLSLDEKDGKAVLNLKAHAMIYYLNYNDPSALKYRLHLVKSSKEEYTYEAENFACPVNYSQALKSSYDMTYICFSLEADITELSGSYDMILEIENTQDGTTYRDIVNMSTETKEFSPLVLNDKTYAVEKTGSLNKNILKVR